jgi:hypothetical protein
MDDLVRPNMRLSILSLVLLSSLSVRAAESKSVASKTVAATPAPAAKTEAATVDTHKLYMSLNVGGLFSQPFNKLGASGLVGARAGYILPFRPGQFVVALEGGYAAPGATGTATDPRVTENGGSYNWTLSERQGYLGLQFMHRATWLGTEKLTPFVGIGPRLWLLQSRVTGKAGTSDLLLSTEQSTQVGFLLPIGVEYKLGPGAITGEAQISWAPVSHRITGDTNVGALSLAVGYRLLLL